MSKGKGISVTSFFDLKSELAKQEAEFAKEKAAGKPYVVGGIKRPDKKPTVWQRQNKGVAARAQRDAEMSVSQPALEDARSALERKAKIYDKLRKGKTGGLDEKQYDSLLVDFDLKAVEDGFESDSDDEDESRTVPKPPIDDDPLVEYEDEFGRMRTARRSEVPRHLAHQPEPDIPEEDDPYVIRGRDINYFPTFQQSEEKVAAIKESLIEDPLNLHYDASKEVRAKGAGFYNFSGNKEERERQMEELKDARDNTVRTRGETGADEPANGPEASSSGTSGSRAMEKRKRDIEERRKAIEAKRRKVASTDPPPHAIPTSSTSAAPRIGTVDPFAVLEGQSKPAPASSTVRRTKAAAADPFAKLEVKFQSEASAADQFLANLEQDMHRR